MVVAYIFPRDTLLRPEQIDAVSLTRINYALANIVDGRVPCAKILLGVRFYSHAWAYVSELNNGLFQPGQPVPQGYPPYSLLDGAIAKSGFTRYWDSVSSAPHLYDPAKQTFVSYEDTESLALKGDHVLDHRLGGIMFWDDESDPSGQLLAAVNNSLHRIPATHQEAQ
jgi:chitinase